MDAVGQKESWMSNINKDTLLEMWEDPPTTEVDVDSITRIYFDQKAWGDLLDGRLDTNSKYHDTYNLAKKSVEDFDYVYPFSLANLMESSGHADREFRRNMYNLIWELSKNHSLRNYFEAVNQECYSYVCRNTSHMLNFDIRKEIFGKGLIYPHGKFRLKPEGWLSEAQREKIHRILQADSINEQIFKSDEVADWFEKKEPEEKKRYEQSMADIKEDHSSIGHPDSEESRAAFIFSSSKSHLLECIIRIGAHFGANVTNHIIDDIFNRGIHGFFSQFPAFYTYANLSFARFSHIQRDIEYNDLTDIMSLAVATPYSDAVVAEKFFGGMLHRYSINKIFDTKVYTDSSELDEMIENEF